MKNVIEIKNLEKKYNDFKLDNINLKIPKGSIVGLIGQNGAGKTTLIKLILEIIKKDKGEISIFDGMNIGKAKEKIGTVLDGAFFPEIINIADVNTIMKNMYKTWDESLFTNYLNEFKLNKKASIKSLSTGMRKKLEIASSLSHHPDLLILDEPTSGLDPVVRKEILDIFLEFVEDEEHTIIISSHITSDLESIADYIVFLDNGKIVLNDNIINIKEKYGIIKCNDKEFATIDKKDIITYINKKYDNEVLVSNKKECKKKYKNMIIDNPSLDDIMLFITKGEK